LSAAVSIEMWKLYCKLNNTACNNNHNLTTMFMVLSSWPWSLREFTRFIWCM